MISYKGAKYKLADVPPNMEPTTPADPRALVTDKEVDEREITAPEKPKKVRPFDPVIGVVVKKLENRLERLEKMTLPIKQLEKLIPRYKLPSAQILISDWRASKDRLTKKLEEVIEELGKDDET